MRAIDASKNAHGKRLRTVFNPLISPENLWPRQGSPVAGFYGAEPAAKVRAARPSGASIVTRAAPAQRKPMAC
jgi:hypothetical protein